MPEEAYYSAIDTIKAGILVSVCIVAIACVLKKPDLGITGVFAMGALLMSCMHYADDLMQPQILEQNP